MTPALLAAVGAVLLVSGAAHLRRPAELRAGLRAHGVLRGRPATWAAGILATEIALGAALVVAATAGLRDVALASALGATALFAAMTAYVHTAARRHAGRPVPCACGVGEAPLGPWVTIRAALLAGIGAVAALGTALGGAGRPVLARPVEEVTILACATLALAVSLALLPAARAEAPLRVGASAPGRRP